MTQIASKAVGIDLGTTNSAVAVMDPTDTDIVIHRDPVSKSRTTPSCVWRADPGSELIVGRKALARIGNRNEPVRSIKRRMGQSSAVLVGGAEMLPEEVSAAILAEMKRQIEEDVAGMATADTTWLVDRAIVTVPAYFDQPQIDATRKAAELAGLECLELLHEPTAAASYHCWRTGTRDGVFLVYDLGGGTFDVSVVRCTAGVYEVLGISGNNRLGGDNIDADLALRLQDMLVSEGWALDLDPEGDPADRSRFNQLKHLAEGVKKGLSGTSEFILRDTGTLKDKNGDAVSIETMIERPDLDAVARPLVERTLQYCHEALEQAERHAGVNVGEVDEVILAGGSTHLPLVRELVTAELCGRARCDEPVFDRVDTIVALGAAVRASVTGGLALYDPGRTVRVLFRGTSASRKTTTHVGGTVESLPGGPDLTDGFIRLMTPDGGGEESDLDANGAFSFRGVPLEPDVETQLSFEVLDADGRAHARVGRPIVHSDEGARRLPGPSSTAVCAKPIKLEVTQGGGTGFVTLIPELAALPTRADFTFVHPGDTATLLFHVYQRSKKIKVIEVPVDWSVPRGTPIRLSVEMDALSLLTALGTIQGETFEFEVEAPPERPMPTEADLAETDRSFDEAVSYLPAGQANTVRIQYESAHDAFRKALEMGDGDGAVHELEQLEEIVARISRKSGPLEPPKATFDQLVDDCTELLQNVSSMGASGVGTGPAFDPSEVSRGIETQRAHGEKAFRAADQASYAEAFRQLTGYREFLVNQIRSTLPSGYQPSEPEIAMMRLGTLMEELERVRSLVLAHQRNDLLGDVDRLRRRIERAGDLVQDDATGVLRECAVMENELQRLQNDIVPRPDAGKLPEDHPHDRGLR
ncbi:Hsp70 family protein [Actinomadura sp. 9N215]|uniref:Hsp70 family protein n=1 Tax=Actinomadura sp. 9N215 TaxID=3375150 RepID=UPI0037BA8443